MTARQRTVQAALVGILRERGPLDDAELLAAYRELNADGALPRQSPRALANRVRELLDDDRIRPRWEAT